MTISTAIRTKKNKNLGPCIRAIFYTNCYYNNNNNNNNNNNLFTYNAQVSIYIFTCAELKFIITKTNYKFII